MMLQILVYAYLRNIYSSRRIEEFCRNDIRFMWLTGTRVPDHNTINRCLTTTPSTVSAAAG